MLLLSSFFVILWLCEAQANREDYVFLPKKLFEHKLKVDYTSCDHIFWDDEAYYEEGCHKNDLYNVIPIHDKYGSEVPKCCEFHGYLEIGNCYGLDKKGNTMKIANLKVCHDHSKDDEVHHPAEKYLEIIKNCPKYCNYKSGFLKDSKEINTEGDKPLLTIGNSTTEDFCLDYGCNIEMDESYVWEVQYEACLCVDVKPPSVETGQNPTKMERTYIMIKPDGVQRGFIGRIISRFEDKGFRLAGLKMLLAEESVLDEHYAELKDRPFYPGLLEYIKSGPVVAMVWEGLGVVSTARQMLGATNPANSPPGTIRGDFGVVPGRNIIHGSDSPGAGEREAALWFSEEELLQWTPSQTSWVYDD